MALEKIRTRLERRLKRKLHDPMWDELVKRERLSADAEMDENDMNDLEDEARSLLRASRRSAPVSDDEKTDYRIIGYHHERRQTLALCAASMAEDHPEVRSFRDEVLGDAFPLTYDQALRYVDADGYIRADALAGCSGRLEGITKTLSETYRWKPEDASWFVLCAYYTPPVNTFKVESEVTHRDHGPEIGTITLAVEPWLPVEIVAAMYTDERRRMIGSQPRTIISKRLRLLEFVRMMGKGLSWGERMDSWNKLEAQKTREEYTDRGNFRRAYEHVNRAVLQPGYNQQHRDHERARDERRRRIERTLRNAERETEFILRALPKADTT